MALHWQWAGKCGEITVRCDISGQESAAGAVSLYTGNAFLIMLSENDEDNTYSLYGFFDDKQHMRNCLGLNKRDGYTENLYNRPTQRWTKIRINKRKYNHTKELVSAIAEAFDNITIEIYAE